MASSIIQRLSSSVSKTYHSVMMKGVLIILALTSLQLICLSTYEILVARADRLAAIELHDKEVGGQVNWLSTLMALRGLISLDRSANGAAQDAAMLSRCTEQIRISESVLIEMLPKSDAKALTSLIDPIVAHWKQIDSYFDQNPDAIIGQIAGKAQLRELYAELAQLRLKIILTDRTKLPLTHELLPQTRDQLKAGIHILFVVIIASALAITLFFLKAICARLSYLEMNMDRFERNEELLPVRAGRNDEIARLEQRFHDLTNALLEASRQKQEILSMVSHDLRTPLNSVQALLTLLAIEAVEPLPSESKQMVERARKNLARMTKLINDLLDVEKLSSGTLTLFRENCSLRNLAESCRDSLSDLAEQKGIEIQIPSTDYEIDADQDRIIQVLTNLVSNALKFSEKGSKITIAAQPIAAETIEVQVIDHGRGIPDDFKTMVFERFKQVSPDDNIRHKGTGLGLAICKSFVELHGETIGIRDTEGGGSTFWFTLKTSPHRSHAEQN